MNLTDVFKERAKKSPKKIVFPEGADERILTAAAMAAGEGIAEPILLGKLDEIQENASRLHIDISKLNVYDPRSSSKLDRYAAIYSGKRTGVSEGTARKLLRRNLFFAAMMVSEGAVDGMVAGATHPTAIVLQTAGLAIGFEPGISGPSSFFIMVVPQCLGESQKVLIFADAGVNIDPSPQQLAEIAITSGKNAQFLLGIRPRIALLSFSTKGSASHPSVDKVVEATRIAREKAPELYIDGELQADAALVPEVARKKVNESKVAGKANVLIFPDLNAGNIAYKLTQYLAGAEAYGPMLQGFAKPVSDLSRGATPQDILGVIAITVVEAQREEKNSQSHRGNTP